MSKSSCLVAAALVLLGIASFSMAPFPANLRGEARTHADEPALNTLSDAEREAGWKLLFDGKTTDGWRKYKGASIPQNWKAVDGVLVYQPEEGKSGGDIVSQDQYENFELAVDWKISEGGNSGIMYRVAEKADYPWRTGPEYQICDNAKHEDGKSQLTAAASCYAVYAVSKDVTKPAGEWNKARIVVDGNHVEHWLNGETVVKYELGSPDWQKHVQASKFRTMRGYGKEAKGYISLQDHGDRVEFRNIKIRLLGEKKKTER